MDHKRAIIMALMFLATSVWPCRASGRCLPARSQAGGDYVVLVHGLGRTAFSLKRIEWALARAGYRVINLSYPSTRLSVEQAADGWLATLLEKRIPDPTAQIHFVTHSLGGLVVRKYL